MDSNPRSPHGLTLQPEWIGSYVSFIGILHLIWSRLITPGLLAFSSLQAIQRRTECALNVRKVMRGVRRLNLPQTGGLLFPASVRLSVPTCSSRWCPGSCVSQFEAQVSVRPVSRLQAACSPAAPRRGRPWFSC